MFLPLQYKKQNCKYESPYRVSTIFSQSLNHSYNKKNKEGNEIADRKVFDNGIIRTTNRSRSAGQSNKLNLRQKVDFDNAISGLLAKGLKWN